MPEYEKTPKPDEKQDDPQGKDDDASPDTDGEHDYKAGEAKWKAMSRKWEGQAKTNSGAQKRLDEIEEANKTEAQKAADKATLSDKAATDAKQELARLRVAMRKGLTEAQAKRLIGATEEELEADADELLESFGGDKTPPGKGGKPKERLRSGAAPDEEPDETDPRKLAASVPRL